MDRQQELDFPAAQAEERERRFRLGQALAVVGADPQTRLLAGLIYTQTRDGLGDPWLAAEGVVRGHVWGPRCARSTLFRICGEAGGLIRRESSAGGAGEASQALYWIDWAVVYEVCGLALPPLLAAAAGAQQGYAERLAGAGRQSAARTGQSAARTGQSAARTEGAENHIYPRMRAPPRADSDLTTDSDDVDVVSKSQVSYVSRRVAELPGLVASGDIDATVVVEEAIAIKERLLGPHTRANGRDARFLVSLCLLQSVLTEGWLQEVVEVTARSRAGNKLGFLHSTARNWLHESVDICRDQAQAIRTFKHWLAAVAPAAAEVMRRAAEKRKG